MLLALFINSLLPGMAIPNTRYTDGRGLARPCPARLGLEGVSVKLRRYDACGGKEGKGPPVADDKELRVSSKLRASVYFTQPPSHLVIRSL